MISIIIPIYQCKWNIEKILQDISKQTYQDYEVLLVDDGSTDGSGETCKRYAEQNEKVYAILKKHGGVGDTRNVGISYAKGEYIAFIDSDDRIDNDYLETLIAGVEKYDLIISSFDRIFYKDNKYVRTVKTSPIKAEIKQMEELEKSFSELYISTLIGTVVCKLFKREVIRKNNIVFRSDIYLGEDFIFNFDYLRCCKSVRCVDYIGYHYICREGNSLTHKNDLQKFDYGKILFAKSLEFCGDMQLSLQSQGAVADLYLRTCFKNIECAYSLENNLRLSELYAYIKKIMDDIDTKRAIKLSNTSSIEFRIYKEILKTQSVIIVGAFAWMRLLYKKITGRA